MPPDTVLYKPPEPQYDKRGNPILCQACHGTGYLGRTAVFAVLRVDEEMQKAIASGSLTEIKAAAARKGGLSLQQPALQKVLQGITSIEEVVRVTRPPRTGGDKPARKKPAASGSDKPSAA